MQSCLMCQQETNEGLSLLTKYLCKHCEHELIHIDVYHPLYMICIDKLKEIKLV